MIEGSRHNETNSTLTHARSGSGALTKASTSRGVWCEALATPRAPAVNPSQRLSHGDLATVRDLFSRIQIPWRIFLAHSLFQQITIPEIAVTVSLSKRYATNPRERMEATRGFLKTIILDGPDSPSGEAAIKRVNEVHREMGIDSSSQAFSFVLFTLSHGFIGSLRSNSSIAPSQSEELALFRFMRRVGEKMGALNLPVSYEDFITSNQQFQTERWRAPSEAPREVAHSIMHNAFARFPAPARPLIRGLALSLVGCDILGQLGIKPPRAWVRGLARLVVGLLT